MSQSVNTSIANMGSWHEKAQAGVRKASNHLEIRPTADEDSKLYQTTLESFAKTCEDLSKLDQSGADLAPAPGEVKTRKKNGDEKALVKTQNGFDLAVCERSVSPSGTSECVEQHFQVNQNDNTITVFTRAISNDLSFTSIGDPFYRARRVGEDFVLNMDAQKVERPAEQPPEFQNLGFFSRSSQP